MPFVRRFGHTIQSLCFFFFPFITSEYNMNDTSVCQCRTRFICRLRNRRRGEQRRLGGKECAVLWNDGGAFCRHGTCRAWSSLSLAILPTRWQGSRGWDVREIDSWRRNKKKKKRAQFPIGAPPPLSTIRPCIIDYCLGLTSEPAFLFLQIASFFGFLVLDKLTRSFILNTKAALVPEQMACLSRQKRKHEKVVVVRPSVLLSVGWLVGWFVGKFSSVTSFLWAWPWEPLIRSTWGTGTLYGGGSLLESTGQQIRILM